MFENFTEEHCKDSLTQACSWQNIHCHRSLFACAPRQRECKLRQMEAMVWIMGKGTIGSGERIRLIEPSNICEALSPAL